MSLILLPNTLGTTFDDKLFAAALPAHVAKLDGLIAENPQEGRKYLKRFATKKPAHLIPIAHLRLDSPPDELDFFLKPIKEGQTWGLISDAGLPCIADPGCRLVERARRHKIPIDVIMGPSSIFLGLMLSGLNGQRFFFHGYLPKAPQELRDYLKRLEKGVTHIAIETPFRANKLLKTLLAVLPKKAKLVVAVDLGTDKQQICTGDWPDLEGRQSLFLFEEA